jgi:hypothetical protein
MPTLRHLPVLPKLNALHQVVVLQLQVPLAGQLVLGLPHVFQILRARFVTVPVLPVAVGFKNVHIISIILEIKQSNGWLTWCCLSWQAAECVVG